MKFRIIKLKNTHTQKSKYYVQYKYNYWPFYFSTKDYAGFTEYFDSYPKAVDELWKLQGYFAKEIKVIEFEEEVK